MNKATTIDKIQPHDILFVTSAVIFNLAISGVYVSSKIDVESMALKIFGGIVVALIIPFTITFIKYVKTGAARKIIIAHIFILFYLLLELMLDYILKIPFRDILPLHVFYIVAFYPAVFSMIGVARLIGRKAGLLVIAAFVILIGCLVYNLT